MRAADTQEAIRREALAMMREEPIDRIKVRPLCERAGVGRSTFYAHYDSVYDVFQEIEDDIFAERERLAHGLRTNTPEGLRAGIHETLTFSRNHLDVLQPLLGENGDAAFRARWTRTITTSIKWPRSRASAGTLARDFVVGGVQQMITGWVQHPERASIDQVEDMVYSCLTEVVPVLVR